MKYSVLYFLTEDSDLMFENRFLITICYETLLTTAISVIKKSGSDRVVWPQLVFHFCSLL